ncbi:MAG: hypothetical protein IJ735_01345 [Clostridia bacterium]|nr:hypothetical protein [Clostridia bacterium]
MEILTKSERENDGKKTVYYKCSVCGVLHEGADGAPKSCMKCDNDKFYKIYK